MNIKEVATSPNHRHKAFAERVLEDDLAWWACFLFPFERMIKTRGGTVRPRVEFSERQARVEAWMETVCAKFDAQTEEEEEAKEEPAKPNPDQGVQIVNEFGMDDEFFNELADEDAIFFVND